MDNPFLVTALVKFRQDTLLDYYNGYVKNLEKDHDELLEENRLLRKKLKDKSNTDYRELAIKMKNERDFYKKIAKSRK